jgi:hypothetical protein
MGRLPTPDAVAQAALATLALPSTRARLGAKAERYAREVWCAMQARHRSGDRVPGGGDRQETGRPGSAHPICQDASDHDS